MYSMRKIYPPALHKDTSRQSSSTLPCMLIQQARERLLPKGQDFSKSHAYSTPYYSSISSAAKNNITVSGTGTPKTNSKQTHAEKSTCTCNNNTIIDFLNTWEQKIQLKLDAFELKLEESTKNIDKSVKEEIANLRNKIASLNTGKKIISQPTSIDLSSTPVNTVASASSLDNDILNDADVASCSNLGSSHLTYQSNSNYNNNNIHGSLIFNLAHNINNNINNNRNNNVFNSHITLNSHSFKQNYNTPINLSLNKTHPKQTLTHKTTHSIMSQSNHIPGVPLHTHSHLNNNNNHSNNNHKMFTTLENDNTITRMEDYEIYIAGFMPLTLQDNLTGLCYSIFHGISHTFNINEIIEARLLCTNNPTGDSTQTTINNDSNTGHPSLIVRLSTVTRVKQILAIKRTITYYNTKDLELTHLGEDFVSRVPTTKLIINEVLSSTEYHRFKTLRKHAKNIGFKYVWHVAGRFLARWDSTGRTHFFNSTDEIDTIKNQQVIHSTHNNSGDKTDKMTK